MSVEVSAWQAATRAREARLRKQWMRLWEQIGDRILRLPKREQDILLEDFHTAIESRIIVFERITNEQR